MSRFVFTCGGTAGHINPALAVAERLRELLPSSEFLFIGANGHMEMQLVPNEGFEIKPITITNLSRKTNFEGIKHNILTIKNAFVSTIDAKDILKEFKPNVVIGTGGYVCYPVLTAAHQIGIPTVLLESNAFPGVTSKLISHFANKVLVGYKDTEDYYKHPDRVTYTGTPVRGSFDKYTKQSARKELGLNDKDKIVVSILGSLGAEFMNNVIAEIIPFINEKKDIFLIHSTGKRYYEKFSSIIKQKCDNYDSHRIDIRDYINDTPRVMMAADLIICRSGASTLSELEYIGKPAILVPSPNVTANHQEKNARVLEKAGAAIVLTEPEIEPKSLFDLICSLLENRNELEEMSSNMKKLTVKDATENISKIILDLIN